jgi:predicted transporter
LSVSPTTSLAPAFPPSGNGGHVAALRLILATGVMGLFSFAAGLYSLKIYVKWDAERKGLNRRGLRFTALVCDLVFMTMTLAACLVSKHISLVRLVLDNTD